MDIAFRKTVIDISHALSSYDLQQIIYLFRIPEHDTKLHALSVLKQLERDGHFSAAKPEGLEKLLQDIHRSDLSSRVQDYCSQFRHSSTCKRLTELAELCLTQAENTDQRIRDLQQELDKFSNNHRKTPTTENFCREMDKKIKSVQNDFTRFLISPLQDLHTLVAAGANTAEKKGKFCSVHKGHKLIIIQRCYK